LKEGTSISFWVINVLWFFNFQAKLQSIGRLLHWSHWVQRKQSENVKNLAPNVMVQRIFEVDKIDSTIRGLRASFWSNLEIQWSWVLWYIALRVGPCDLSTTLIWSSNRFLIATPTPTTSSTPTTGPRVIVWFSCSWSVCYARPTESGRRHQRKYISYHSFFSTQKSWKNITPRSPSTSCSERS
jgi:hypothetical protein